MRSRNNREAPGSGGNQISGSLVTGNVQMASGDVAGGMSMTVGASTDARADLRAAVDQLDSALSTHSGQEVEQARTALSMIEQEAASASPERARVRAALTKLQEIALSLGSIAAAVNNVGAAIARLGLH